MDPFHISLMSRRPSVDPFHISLMCWRPSVDDLRSAEMPHVWTQMFAGMPASSQSVVPTKKRISWALPRCVSPMQSFEVRPRARRG